MDRRLVGISNVRVKLSKRNPLASLLRGIRDSKVYITKVGTYFTRLASTISIPITFYCKIVSIPPYLTIRANPPWRGREIIQVHDLAIGNDI